MPSTLFGSFQAGVTPRSTNNTSVLLQGFQWVQLYRWFEIRAFLGNQGMPLAKAEAQTLVIFLTLTLMCGTFRIILTGQEIRYCVTRVSGKLNAMFFVIRGYQGIAVGHAVGEADSSKRVFPL